MRGDIVRKSFGGLIGVSPVNDGLTPIVPSSLQSSTSGFFLGSETDALLGMNNVFKASAAMYNYQLLEDNVYEWDADVSYRANVLVRVGNLFYRSLQDTLAGTAVGDGDYWEPSSIFGEYLRRGMEAAALTTVTAVLKANSMDTMDCQPLLVESPIYLGDGRRGETGQPHSRFVGYTIQLLHRNTSFTIDKISTQLSLPQNITLYLYSTDMAVPLKTWEVEHGVGGNMEEHEIEPYVIFSGFSLLSGTYRIGYYEDDLEGMAIWKKIDLNPSCGSCRPRDHRLTTTNRKYVIIRPFYVPVDDLNQDTYDIWDADAEDYDITQSNFGFNVWASVSCDLTDFIVRHKALFAPAYMARLKADFLRIVSFSTRGTDEANKTRSMIQQIGGNAKKYNQDKGPKILDDDNEQAFMEAVYDCAAKLSGDSGICFPVGKGKSRIRITSL